MLLMTAGCEGIAHNCRRARCRRAVGLWPGGAWFHSTRKVGPQRLERTIDGLGEPFSDKHSPFVGFIDDNAPIYDNQMRRGAVR